MWPALLAVLALVAAAIWFWGPDYCIGCHSPSHAVAVFLKTLPPLPDPAKTP